MGILSRIKNSAQKEIPKDFEEFHRSVYSKVKPYTMTSAERIFGLIEAIKYLSRNKIEGDIVECGVWKGGSMLATAITLVNEKDDARNLFMYDTYEGMSAPTDNDKTFFGEPASKMLKEEDRQKNPIWCYSSLEEVRNNMKLSGYNEALIHYVKGKVEDTIPKTL